MEKEGNGITILHKYSIFSISFSRLCPSGSGCERHGGWSVGWFGWFGLVLVLKGNKDYLLKVERSQGFNVQR